MSSITPWIDDMDKCTCGYIERIRASRPEFDELYRKVQFDIKGYFAKRKSTHQTDIFEKWYLNPMLKALTLVNILIQEDSLNSLSEAVVRKALKEALQKMPKKKTNNQILEVVLPSMLSIIYQISSVTRRIANGWGKVVYAMCIHHSFLPQESEEPVESPEEGELVDSFTERHGRQFRRAGNGRYLTPTERFGNCVSCSESSLVSLHGPTRDQSIERSFFDEDEPGIVMIQAWRCKDPLRKRGRNSDLDPSGVTRQAEYITTKIIPALPVHPTEDSSKGSGRTTYPYTLEHYKMGDLHPDAKYYSGGAEGRSKAALHAFLEGIDPDFLTFIDEELELHHGTLQMSETDSKSKLSARRTDPTGALLDKEVVKPASTISEIRREIEELRALPAGTYWARSSAYSVTDVE